MSLEIIRNDITKVHADAIVNTANPNPTIGSGVDSAIYTAAGEKELLEERKKIGAIEPGKIAVTHAFKLPSKYIIHTVGPIWNGGNSGELDIVSKCYRKSLNKAKELECESIAFPLISSGTYGFPKDIALKIAISEIREFLFNNEMTVYLVVYDRESFEISSKAFKDINEYIDEKEVFLYDAQSIERPSSVEEKDDIFSDVTYGKIFHKEHKVQFVQKLDDFLIGDEEEWFDDSEEYDEADEEDIDDRIRSRDETFQEYLFRIIDRKGLDDKEVYKKANIDRKHFSKIRNNINYNPSKKTAVALAIALELNLDETKDLLLKAGIALTRSNIFDIIIEYCIEHHINDIYEINCILFKYDQPTLGV